MNTLNRIGLICFIIGALGIYFLIGYYVIYMQFGLLATVVYSLAILMLTGGCLTLIADNSK